MGIIKKNKFLLAFLLDLIVITVSFFIAIYLKRGNFVLTKEYRLLLFFFYSVWFISSIISKKYSFIRSKNIREWLSPFFRSFLYMAILLFFIIFIFKLFYYSRFIILAMFIIYLFIEIFAYVVFYIYKWGPNANIVNENNIPMDYKAIVELQDEESHIDIKGRQIKESLRFKLKEIYLKQRPFLIFEDYFPLKFFNFIDSAINLDFINASDSILLDTNSSNTVQSILNDKLEFIGNLHKINDIQRINKFFITINQNLTWGGYFLGVVETLEQRLERRFSKFPKFIKKFFYLIDFAWTSIFPKLFLLKKIYFMIREKDRRVISKWEILGRLHFCGFKIIKMDEIDKKLYFIAKKVRTPLEDKTPSYGPIFKQKRMGLNGEVIYTYKFRTMYPYSEYIHKYMLDQYKLNPIGKIENDIRITSWGRIMRKYWIDELPMLINLLQGDLKLVGLRPISKSFFNIYPEDLKKERMKNKSGLFPAFYADMPRSIKEIWESERKYIKECKKYPWKTNFIYFFRIINNILFHKVRSD